LHSQRNVGGGGLGVPALNLEVGPITGASGSQAPQINVHTKNYTTVDPKQWVDSRRVFEEQGQTHDMRKHQEPLTAHCLGKDAK